MLSNVNEETEFLACVVVAVGFEFDTKHYDSVAFALNSF